MKIFGVFLFLALTLFALEPIQKAKIKSGVLDMVLANSKIYLATDGGEVVILDMALKPIKRIKVRKVKDFLGELHPADIYSVDVIGKDILYLAQAEDGYAELFLNGKKIIDKSQKLYAKAAKFIDKNYAIMALMSDEVVKVDLKSKKIVQKAAPGAYFYSCSAISPNRKYFVIGDEGGEVIVIDTATLKTIKLFKDINKDKILSLFINKNLIASGGRDKAFVLYNLDGGHKIKKNNDFFVYVVALSPDNKRAVFGDNEKYILKVVNSDDLSLQQRLIGHKNIVNVVRFINQKELLSASETGEILKWRLP